MSTDPNTHTLEIVGGIARLLAAPLSRSGNGCCHPRRTLHCAFMEVLQRVKPLASLSAPGILVKGLWLSGGKSMGLSAATATATPALTEGAAT